MIHCTWLLRLRTYRGIQIKMKNGTLYLPINITVDSHITFTNRETHFIYHQKLHPKFKLSAV